MNTDSINDEHQNFEHNIKKEPEEEFLCILPSFVTGIVHEADFVQVKQEKEIQSEKISKLQCKICQKIFGSNHQLRKHEEAHQKQQCKICNRKLPPQSFEKHMKRHQNEKSGRKFECEICFHKFLTKKQFLTHVLKHSKRFECDLCGHFSTSVKLNLMKHLNLHLVQGQYKCKFCRKLFDDRESFRLHSWQVHGDPKNRKGFTKADLYCGTCGKECDDVKARKQHEKSHGEKVQCSFCDKKVKQNSLAQHLKLHELIKKRKTFICDICLKSFFTEASLKYHKRIHNKFKCDICGYESTNKHFLKDHLESHFNLVKIQCNICWKKFTDRNSLKNHSRKIHNLNVDPSKLCCNICHVKCRNLSVLKAHELNHKTPKTCPICSKSIKPISFSNHMKLHELKKEEKKIECKVCRMKFYFKSTLSFHMKSHNKSLECDLCEYRTGRKKSMNYHMANHTEQKPFKCEICHRGFSSRANLKRHRSVHFHPFRCNLCPASFVLEEKLNHHIQAHDKQRKSKSPIDPI